MDPMLLLLLIAVAVAIYLIPTWVALGRKHRKKFAIFMVNLLLGWTLLGWHWRGPAQPSRAGSRSAPVKRRPPVHRPACAWKRLPKFVRSLSRK